ncbi:recombinase family protein [Bradyrhizobium sp. ORS 285]|uniref:recombinase family protein n=1 Tax=Bradyrhizobium sp. ORS 285 TaxID=115808 RepID=UPI001FCC147C|nr:recombinase family protein [Bradyrhizobium sp. ORS 285]
MISSRQKSEYGLPGLRPLKIKFRLVSQPKGASDACGEPAEGMMMVNALVIRETHLPQAPNGRAAQYVRMSTDYQRYSIQNQAAVIAAYAHAHGLAIVKTFADHGESGLKIKNRPGLAKLIEDVSSGRAEFDHILVYDISRWGRFQDVDEAAHYEFICKQAGIKVSYCAEQFDNDGSMLSNIVKNLKRVMAAEYSRELSVKVHTGICRFVGLGFLPGGPVGYGLERVLVNERLEPKKVMQKGERKYLHTDHIRLRPGDAHEVAIVKRIFARFVQVKSEKAIARELNCEGVWCRGKAWRAPTISRILRNENYIGNLVYNRQSKKLGGERINNPSNLWVRAEQCFEAIVSKDIFLTVQKIMKERRVDISEEEMLLRLKKILKREGRLTPTIINATAELPSARTFVDHFGTLRNAYRLIGYQSSRRCEYMDSRRAWVEPLSALAGRICQVVQKAGYEAAIHSVKSRWLNVGVPEQHVIVDSRWQIFFRIAYWTAGARPGFSPFWTVSCRRLPTGWIVAIRLNEHNEAILDYALMPTAQNNSNMIRFREKGRAEHGVTYFKTEVELVRSVVRLLTNETRVARSERRKLTRSVKRFRSNAEGADARRR